MEFVVYNSQYTTYYKINNSTTLLQVWNSYCQRIGDYDYIFTLDGDIINKDFFSIPIKLLNTSFVNANKIRCENGKTTIFV